MRLQGNFGSKRADRLCLYVYSFRAFFFQSQKRMQLAFILALGWCIAAAYLFRLYFCHCLKVESKRFFFVPQVISSISKILQVGFSPVTIEFSTANINTYTASLRKKKERKKSAVMKKLTIEITKTCARVTIVATAKSAMSDRQYNHFENYSAVCNLHICVEQPSFRPAYILPTTLASIFTSKKKTRRV